MFIQLQYPSVLFPALFKENIAFSYFQIWIRFVMLVPQNPRKKNPPWTSISPAWFSFFLWPTDHTKIKTKKHHHPTKPPKISQQQAQKNTKPTPNNSVTFIQIKWLWFLQVHFIGCTSFLLTRMKPRWFGIGVVFCWWSMVISCWTLLNPPKSRVEKNQQIYIYIYR